MRSRTLVLRKETLTALDTGELASVVGASNSDECVTFTRVPTGCFCSGVWPSLNVNCPSIDLDCPR